MTDARPATRKQLWTIFTLTKQDLRDTPMTVEEAGRIISRAMGEKQAKVENWARIWGAAHQAGIDAGNNRIPVPMIVQQRANPDDSSPVIKEYEPVMDGVCGFAWIKIRPATHVFCRWLKKNGIGKTAYGGGLSIWAHEFAQSYERKMAYAGAAARVIQDRIPELSVYAEGRLD